MRCLLVQAQEGTGPVVLEALPVGTLPQDVLQQGHLYQASVASGVGRLFWQHSALGWQMNELASSLAGTHVCGDAMLVLSKPESELQLQHQVAQLAKQHLRRGTQWCLTGTWPFESDGSSASDPSIAAGTCGGTGSRREQCLEQQQQQLLPCRQTPAAVLQWDGAAAEAQQQQGAEWGETPLVAPSTPQHKPSAATTTVSAPLPDQRQPQPQPQPQLQPQRDRKAARQQAQQAQQYNDVQVFKCEPWQQLLWSIRGRATSLSWQGGAAPAAARPSAAARIGLPCAPAAVPPPDAVHPACITSSTAAAAAAPQAVTEPSAVGLPMQQEAVSGSAMLPAKHRGSLGWSSWAELQPEMLAVVLAKAGHSPHTACMLCQVCTSWRHGVGAERSALRLLRFSRLEPRDRPAGSNTSSDTGSGNSLSSSSTAIAPRTRKSSSGGSVQLPWLVQQAVTAGNVAATVAAARYLERQGTAFSASSGVAVAVGAVVTCYETGSEAAALAPGARTSAAGAAGAAVEAARYWARAAKAGHPEAQWKLGYGHYKGLVGLAHDSEEAAMWLSRAAKQLEAVVVATAPSAPAAGGEEAAVEAATVSQVPLLMTWGGCRQVLAQAAHILGYLFLDGEGTRLDTATAIRWFRLAESCGCHDVGLALGSLYNTGMYG